MDDIPRQSAPVVAQRKRKSQRKSSERVSLVLISAAAVSALATLTGCGTERDRDVRRDVYASKEDCIADWGNDPSDCEPDYTHPGSRGANTVHYGRPYPWGAGGASPSRTGKTIGSVPSVSRGGFGGGARSGGG